MTIEFTGPVWYWRGPAPFYFIVMPDPQSKDLKAVSNLVTYGWGCITCSVTVGDMEWTTALMPKDGKYLVPLRAVYRKALNLDEGDTAAVKVVIGER